MSTEVLTPVLISSRKTMRKEIPPTLTNGMDHCACADHHSRLACPFTKAPGAGVHQEVLHNLGLQRGDLALLECHDTHVPLQGQARARRHSLHLLRDLAAPDE